MNRLAPIFIISILFSLSLRAQSFRVDTINSTLVGSNGILFHDFDGDGAAEHIVARFSQDVVTLVYQDSTGMQERSLLFIDGPIRLHHGDYNGDGLEDISVTASNSTGLTILRNRGNFNFDINTVGSAVNSLREFSAADFDNDGDIDFVVGSLSRNYLAILEMVDTSTFQVVVKFIDRGLNNINETSAGDFNNDGLLDFVACDRFDDAINIYTNTGNLNFQKTSIPSDGVGSNGTADFNNDGLLDFATASFSEGTVRIFTNNGNGTFSNSLTFTPGSGQSSLECYDFNNDGLQDIVVGSNSGLRIYLQTNGATLTFELEEYLFNGFVGPFDLVDIDGDTDMDIVASSTALPGIIHYTNLLYVDMDGDGFYSNVDCKDDDASINPGQTEIPYNGVDDDCDAATLDDDLDQDGFLLADDCDDTNPNINPDQTEIPYNGVDDDCDAATLDDDLDQDGFLLADDCDDTNPNINPDAAEIPGNGIDEDCDGMDGTSSLFELSNGSISIYPNPTTSWINVVVEGNLEYEISLYTLQGRLLYSSTNETLVSLSEQPVGAYILLVEDLKTGETISERILKN